MSTKDDYMQYLEYGDILEFERNIGPFTYYHCGFYEGNNKVIHKGVAPGVGALRGLLAIFTNDVGYRIDPIEQVATGPVYRNNVLDDTCTYCPSKEVMIYRANFYKGEADFHPLYNNCQHFCTKLRYGKAFSRQADRTSEGHDYTKTMVRVSFDDGGFIIARRDININKCIDVQAASFNTSLETQMPRTISNNFENQSEYSRHSYNTDLHVNFFDTSIDTQIPRTVTSSFDNQAQNTQHFVNTDLSVDSFDTFSETPMPQTISSSFKNQTLNAQHLFSTDLCVDLSAISIDTQIPRTVTSSFDNQAQNTQHNVNTDLSVDSFDTSTETPMPQTISCRFKNQTLNAQHLCSTDWCVDLSATSIDTQIRRTVTSSFDNQTQNTQHNVNTDLSVDSFDTSTETPMLQTISSSFNNQTLNEQHLCSTDWCVDLSATSIDTQIPRTVTSSFDNQAQNTQHNVNTDLSVDSFDTSTETPMLQTISSSFKNQTRNPQHFFNLSYRYLMESKETQMASSLENRTENPPNFCTPDLRKIYNPHYAKNLFDTEMYYQSKPPLNAKHVYNIGLCTDFSARDFCAGSFAEGLCTDSFAKIFIKPQKSCLLNTIRKKPNEETKQQSVSPLPNSHYLLNPLPLCEAKKLSTVTCSFNNQTQNVPESYNITFCELNSPNMGSLTNFDKFCNVPESYNFSFCELNTSSPNMECLANFNKFCYKDDEMKQHMAVMDTGNNNLTLSGLLVLAIPAGILLILLTCGESLLNRMKQRLKGYNNFEQLSSSLFHEP